MTTSDEQDPPQPAEEAAAVNEAAAETADAVAADTAAAGGEMGDDGTVPVPDGVEDEPDPEIVPPSGAELRAVVEALVFASPEPITTRQLAQLLEGVPKADLQQALEEVRADCEREGRGLQLVEVAGGWQITTRPQHNEWLRQLLDPKSAPKLSIKALETLAVISYKQPITLPEIIELRGVKSGGVVKTLLERHLVKIVGRKEVVGRPMLYGTTKEFLLQFGLKDLSELPKIEEFADVLGEEVDVIGLKRAIETPTPAPAEEMAEPEPPPSSEPPAGGEPPAGE
jgi:segregation and condensation protein B